MVVIIIVIVIVVVDIVTIIAILIMKFVVILVFVVVFVVFIIVIVVVVVMVVKVVSREPEEQVVAPSRRTRRNAPHRQSRRHGRSRSGRRVKTVLIVAVKKLRLHNVAPFGPRLQAFRVHASKVLHHVVDGHAAHGALGTHFCGAARNRENIGVRLGESKGGRVILDLLTFVVCVVGTVNVNVDCGL
jgi:hypothetical protein